MGITCGCISHGNGLDIPLPRPLLGIQPIDHNQLNPTGRSGDGSAEIPAPLPVREGGDVACRDPCAIFKDGSAVLCRCAFPDRTSSCCRLGAVATCGADIYPGYRLHGPLHAGSRRALAYFHFPPAGAASFRAVQSSVDVTIAETPHVCCPVLRPP